MVQRMLEDGSTFHRRSRSNKIKVISSSYRNRLQRQSKIDLENKAVLSHILSASSDYGQRSWRSWAHQHEAYKSNISKNSGHLDSLLNTEPAANPHFLTNTFLRNAVNVYRNHRLP